MSMEVIKVQNAMLSNYEVYKLMEELRSTQKKGSTQSRLATVTYEVSKYLQNSPCVSQSPEKIDNFLKAVKPYNLKKEEKLMFINNPPTTLLEIQLAVENSEERLTEEQCNELLDIMKTSGLVN